MPAGVEDVLITDDQHAIQLSCGLARPAGESDNIRQARDCALADAIRASGAPRIEAWGPHNDPVKGLPVGGVILDAQRDGAGVWAWMRQNGVAWDDSERKGAIPAGRRSDVDIGNAAGDDGEVAPAKLLHPRWRRHVAEPDAFLASGST